jgi:ATP-dependent RNA helicase RhlB
MVRRLFQKIKNQIKRMGGKASEPAPKSKAPAASAAPVSHRSTGHKPSSTPHKPAVSHPAHRQSEPHKPAPVRHMPRPVEPLKKWVVSDYVVPPVEGKVRFHDLNMPEQIMHAVNDLGFKYCTAVQAVAIPPSLEGRDVTGKAQTGTGKTAAFLIAMFTHFLRHPRKRPTKLGAPRALILAPTRELVIQIEKDARDIGKYCGFSILGIYGGMDYDKQQRQLREVSPEIMVATPGRLLDFRRGGLLDLKHVEVLVIDEADRMLDMGFIPDVRTIVYSMPRKEERQTLLFSATLTEDILRLASKWTNEPIQIEIEPEKVTVDNIKQVVYTVPSDKRFALFYNLLQRDNPERVLMFCNRRDDTERVLGYMERCGIKAEMLSGAVPQVKRLRVLEAFRAGTIRVLVATDVAGRGLHVNDISHVINYDIPLDAEDYVHRIGRTGRAGKKGTAYTFACENEAFSMPEIEKYIGRPLDYENPEPELLVMPPGVGNEHRSPRRPSFGRPPGRGSFSRRPARR